MPIPRATWKQPKELVPLIKKGHCFQWGGHELENSSWPFGQEYNVDLPIGHLSAGGAGGSQPVGTTRPPQGRSQRSLVP